jgi:hypothetical protein
MKVALGGGTPVTLGSVSVPSTGWPPVPASAMVDDGTSLYWTQGNPLKSAAGDPYSTDVMKVPLTGGTPTVVIPLQADLMQVTQADVFDVHNSIAVDASSVIWLRSDGTIRKVPK